MFSRVLTDMRCTRLVILCFPTLHGHQISASCVFNEHYIIINAYFNFILCFYTYIMFCDNHCDEYFINDNNKKYYIMLIGPTRHFGIMACIDNATLCLDDS